MDRMTELLAQSVTPGGACGLEFPQMLDVLEAGHAMGLMLFTVDVTTQGGLRPLPEWMFRLTDEEVETVASEQIVPMALEFYRGHATDPELSGASFEVFFERPD
jgi:hypothetical protein